MGEIKQDISFPLKGGLNLDDDLTTFPKGDWRDLENMRSGVSAGEDEGVFESILSDIVRNYSGEDHPTVNCERMGGGTDLRTNKFYLFFKDTNDWIIEYDIENKQYNIVWEDALGILNFNTSYRINNINVLDGILYWTENYNSPRKLDIAKAKVTEEYELYNEIVNVWLVPKTVQETPPGNHIYVAYKGYIYASTQEHPNSDPSTLDGWDLLCAVTDCYPELGEQEIDVITHPPLRAPIASYSTSSSRNYNHLRGRLFQFAYRYVYLDYRKSVYSLASNTPIPVGEELAGGEYVDDITVNNKIEVEINTGSPEVLRIEVIFRTSKDISTWYKAGTVDVYNSSGEVKQEWGDTIDFDFYHEKLSVAVSISDVLRPFDYVPLLAGCQEVIEENRLTYADITEGFPLTKLSVVSEVSKVTQSGLPTVDIETYLRTYYNGANYTSAVVVIFPQIDPAPYEGYKFYIMQNKGVEKTASYTMVNGDTWEDVRDGLIIAMGVQSMDYDDPCHSGYNFPSGTQVICHLQSSHEEDDYSYWDGKSWSIYYDYPIGYESAYPVKKNLKSGAYHLIGFLYKDRGGRFQSVITNSDTKVYVDAYNETGGGNDLKMSEYYKITLITNHIPPSWAKSLELVYAPQQSLIMNVRLNAITPHGSNHVGIDINTTVEEMRDEQEKCTIANYEWLAGDRLRFINRVVNGVEDDPGIGEILDFEIERVDEDGIFVIKEFNYQSYDFDNKTIVEIYRPEKTLTETVFYGIGQEYEIKEDGNGNFYHSGDWEGWGDAIEEGDLVDGRYYKIAAHSIVDFTTRGAANNNVGTEFLCTSGGAVTLTESDSVNQKSEQVLDAQGDNVAGSVIEFRGFDSFKYERKDTEETYWAESPYYSDYQDDGDMYGLGFGRVEDPDAKQVNYDTKYRWGGAYYLDTELNYIAKFDYKDIGTLPDKFGKIQKIIEVGFILKILLSHKNYSLYIRRISYLDAVGEERFTLTDSMFGTKRPSVQDWGTQNPESVIKHEGYLYFWDRSVGKYIRDASNGMFAISDYKVKSFFKNLSLNNPTGAITCYTGYNNRFEELWVTLRYNSTFKTLRFSEYKTRWDGFVNSNPDMYISLLQDFHKLYQEKVYDASSNEGQGYLDFVNKTGNVYPIIEVVGNIDPYKIKIWNAIALYASHVFFAPDNDDIEIPASNDYPEGMKTRILENLVESKEGVWYLPIMMDLNTPGEDWGAAIETGDLINGREYKIAAHSIVDFTTRGAANNNVGTIFVAIVNGAVTLTAVDSVKESHKAVNGRPMRGDVIKIRLRGNEETSEKTLLSKMIIHATPSERSKF